MRIVVRIGGSVVANPINTELIGKYTDIIKAIKEADEKGNREESQRLLELQRDLSKRPGRSIPGHGPGRSWS